MVDYLKFFLISLAWGSSFILMKKAQVCFGPMAISGGRCLLGVVGLSVFLVFRKRRDLLKGQRFWAVVILVLFSYLWPYTLQPIVIGKLDSGFTSIMLAFVPIFTIIASVPLLKQLPSKQEMVGVLGGLACMVILFLDKMKELGEPVYLAVAVTVPLGYAIGNTWNKRSFKSADPLALALVCMVMTGVIMTPLSVIKEPVLVSHSGFSVALGAMLILGIFGTGLTLAMFYGLIRSRGPLFAGMVTYLIPLGGIFFGYLDGETITLRQGLATLGVLISVGATQLRFGKVPDTLQTEVADEA